MRCRWWTEEETCTQLNVKTPKEQGTERKLLVSIITEHCQHPTTNDLFFFPIKRCTSKHTIYRWQTGSLSRHRVVYI